MLQNWFVSFECSSSSESKIDLRFCRISSWHHFLASSLTIRGGMFCIGHIMVAVVRMIFRLFLRPPLLSSLLVRLSVDASMSLGA